MAFFSRPQQKKKSASEEQARSGKKSMAEEKKSMFSFFRGTKKKDVEKSDAKGKAIEDAQKEAEEIKTPAREKFGTASEVILRPRVTEKSTDVSHAGNAYVFEVMPGASKQQIAAGVSELYGVSVVKVHTAKVMEKRIRDRRGRKGMKSGGKKAYVYLKKGDTIEFV